MNKKRFKNVILTVILVLICLGGYIFYFHSRDFTRPDAIIAIAIAAVFSGIICFIFSRETSLSTDTKTSVDLLENVRALIDSIKQAAGEVTSSAQTINDLAEQGKRTSDAFSGSIEDMLRQNAGKMDDIKKLVNSISGMLDQMNSGIEQIAGSASESSATAVSASELAETGKTAMHDVIDKMEKISQSSRHTSEMIRRLGESSETIGQIVETITGIADQTNLLALNAAIEAARAGEQGRGFAVVADEIRKLAEQSGNAAKQIAELIAAVQTETEKAVAAKDEGSSNVKEGIEAVKKAEKSFMEIFSAVQKVSEQMQEISAATQEMAAGTEDTHESFKKMAEITVDTSMDTHEIAESVQSQHMLLEEMETTAKKLKRIVDKFVDLCNTADI